MSIISEKLRKSGLKASIECIQGEIDRLIKREGEINRTPKDELPAEWGKYMLMAINAEIDSLRAKRLLKQYEMTLDL